MSSNEIVAAGPGDKLGLDDSIYNRLLKERIIFLGSEVRDENANAICAQMLLLAAEDSEKDIWLYINSPGGSVTAGMAIFDTMQWVPNDVATVAMGMAASMGQFLLSAGTPGKRYATPHARVMMHQPSGGIGGTASDIKIQAEQLLHIKKQMAELIAEHTGQTPEQIEARLRPRPLVHRRGGQGVRLRRPRVLTRRPGRPLVRQPGHRLTRRPGETTDMNANYPTRPSGLSVPAPSSRYILPQFEERTSYGMKRTDPYTKLFEDRIIFLGVQVDDASADDVIAQLIVLESQDPDRDILMYINSPGGSFTAMTAIYDTMQYIRPDVQTFVVGQAASAAAVLLGAGAKGKRYALPNARVLIHQPAIEGTGGMASDLEIHANEVLRMRGWLEDTIAHHADRDVELVRKDIERDKILSAAQAKEYGLIDEVLVSRKAALEI